MLNPIVTYVLGGTAMAAAFALTARAAAKRLRHAVVRDSPNRGRARDILGLSAGVVLALNLSACGESETSEGDPAAVETSQAKQADEMAEMAENTDGAAAESGESRPVQVTGKEHFQKVTGEGRVLVDFYADWCGPCKAMAPILKDMAQSHSDTLTVAKVNVDKHRELAKAHGVQGIPHLVLYKNGEAVDSSTGYRDKNALTKWLAKSKED